MIIEMLCFKFHVTPAYNNSSDVLGKNLENSILWTI